MVLHVKFSQPHSQYTVRARAYERSRLSLVISFENGTKKQYFFVSIQFPAVFQLKSVTALAVTPSARQPDRGFVSMPAHCADKENIWLLKF